MIEKVNTPSTPGQNIMFDDDILAVINQQYFSRTFSVESEGIYTVNLGVFHDLNRGMLEESALFCTIPTKTACKHQITAVFDIPDASIVPIPYTVFRVIECWLFFRGNRFYFRPTGTKFGGFSIYADIFVCTNSDIILLLRL